MVKTKIEETDALPLQYKDTGNKNMKKKKYKKL